MMWNKKLFYVTCVVERIEENWIAIAFNFPRILPEIEGKEKEKVCVLALGASRRWAGNLVCDGGRSLFNWLYTLVVVLAFVCGNGQARHTHGAVHCTNQS